MHELDALLDLAKSTVSRAANRLLDQMAPGDVHYVHSPEHQREIKAIADAVMEQEILAGLAGAQLSILSEESGYAASPQATPRWFIVDPLDGTFNFVKGLGPSAISVALWEYDRPVFGVIYSLAERQLAWGGRDIGAFIERAAHLGFRDVGSVPGVDLHRLSGPVGHAQRPRDAWLLADGETLRKSADAGLGGGIPVQVARGAADLYAES